jgi:hypothetical protein
MYPIHIISEERRDSVTSEIGKWNPIERTALCLENIKLLPFNLLKLATAYCNDLVEQKSFVNQSSDHNTTESTVGSATKSIDYFSILEVQANDLSRLFT